MASKQIKDYTSEQTVINDDDYFILQETLGTTKKFKIQAIIDVIYPVGCFYTQYANANSSTEGTAFPDTYKPATLFGGTWVEQWDTENIFFRTKGTDYQTRTSGLSADQMQGHYHTSDPVGNTGGAGATNAIVPVGTGNNTSYDNIKSPKTDGTNGTPRVGAVTEPRNRLIKVWKRTA